MKVKFEWNDSPDRITKKETWWTARNAVSGSDSSTFYGSLCTGR